MEYNQNNMDVLLIDLKQGVIEKKNYSYEDEGLSLGIRLHREIGEDSLVLTSSVTLKSLEPSPSWSIVWHSPLLGHETYISYASFHGASLWEMGIKAIVIVGRGDRLRYISLSKDNSQILPCENMRGSTSLSFEEVAKVNREDCVLSTGPAGDSGVKYAVVESEGRIVPGIDLGHIFFLHNLKGIVFPPFTKEKIREKSDSSQKNKKGSWYKRIKSWGSFSYISDALRLGWMPLRAWSDRFDPRSFSLDGKAMTEKYGSFPSSCPGCVLSCRRNTSDGKPLPSWQEIMVLGTNLGLFNPDYIIALYDAVRQEGLNPSIVGSMLAHLLFVDKEGREKYNLSPSSITDIVQFIQRLSSGTILYEGLSSLDGAIQCYDHMPIDFDLRGSSAMALSYSLGLGKVLGSTMVFPKKRPNEQCSSIIAFYETLYVVGLESMGYPAQCPILAYWSKVPQLAYRIPFFARFYSKRFTAYGYSSSFLAQKGLEILKMFPLKWHQIPSHFVLDSDSKKDSETVPLKRLQDYWDEEKLRFEISLKSKRDKSEKPETVKRPKVGPVEERGREGEPGLK